MATKSSAARVRTRAKRSERRWADRIQERLPAPIRGIVTRIREDDVLLLSAGLAFYAVVSMIPLTILIAALASLVLGDQRIHELATQVGRMAPKSLGADQALKQIATQGSRISVVAFLSGVWPATAYGAGLVRAFDDLSPRHRSGPKSLRGRALAFLLLLPLFVVGGIIGSYVGWQILGSSGIVRIVGGALALVVAFLGAGGAIVLIYWFFPPMRLGWRPVLTGAAVTAGCISVLSLAFTLYLTLGANFDQHYATSAVAAFVLLAVWLFLANAMMLVGYKIALEAAER